MSNRRFPAQCLGCSRELQEKEVAVFIQNVELKRRYRPWNKKTEQIRVNFTGKHCIRGLICLSCVDDLDDRLRPIEEYGLDDHFDHVRKGLQKVIFTYYGTAKSKVDSEDSTGGGGANG